MTLEKIICTPLKTLRSLKNSVLVISIFYRSATARRYFYTQNHFNIETKHLNRVLF